MITKRYLVEGLIAGACGYLVVAGLFAFLNVFAGQSPFRTAFLIGQVLGAGSTGPGDAAGIVLAANGLHLAISLAFGVLAAWLILEVERHHDLWIIILMVFIAGFLFMVLFAGIVGAELTTVATWGEVTAASLFFAVTVGGILAWRHRGLGEEIDRELHA
jgi:hypothetical protein